jgi:hypothetical protein
MLQVRFVRVCHGYKFAAKHGLGVVQHFRAGLLWLFLFEE